VYVYLPRAKEKISVLFDKVRARLVARHAAGVPEDGKAAGPFQAEAHPQMMTFVPETPLFIRGC
jgi:hypothetical protein